MKAASIDIGTNSVLLLVCELGKGGSLHVLHEDQAVPRLGKGVDKDKNLHPESQERVIAVLHRYRDFLQHSYPEILNNVVITATSAVRDAGNRPRFVERVKTETGWHIQLLSGAEEARTTFRGALSVLEGRETKNNLILDIGGGSTEIAFGRGRHLERGLSIDMGSVRFTERFFKSDPPDDHQISAVRHQIKKELKGVALPGTGFDAIGVAGTITSIAAIHQNLDVYDAARLNGRVLTRQQLAESIKEFSALKGADIEQRYPPFLTGRGEVILAGALILDEFLEWCGEGEMIVSTGGIRHGILLQT